MSFFSEQIFEVIFKDKFTVSAKRALEKVSRDFDDLASHIEKKFSNLISKSIKGTTLDLSKSIPHISDDVEKNIGGGAKQDDIKHPGHITLTEIENSVLPIPAVLNGIAPGALWGFQKGLEKVETSDSVKNKDSKNRWALIKGVGGAIKKVFSGKLPAFGFGFVMGETLAAFTDMMEVVLSPLVRELGPHMLSIAMSLQPLVLELVPILGELVGSLVPIMTELATTLFPPMLKLIKTLVPFIKYAGEGLAYAIENLLVPALKVLAPILEALGAYFKVKVQKKELTPEEIIRKREEHFLNQFQGLFTQEQKKEGGATVQPSISLTSWKEREKGPGGVAGGVGDESDQPTLEGDIQKVKDVGKGAAVALGGGIVAYKTAKWAAKKYGKKAAKGTASKLWEGAKWAGKKAAPKVLGVAKWAGKKALSAPVAGFALGMMPGTAGEGSYMGSFITPEQLKESDIESGGKIYSDDEYIKQAEEMYGGSLPIQKKPRKADSFESEKETPHSYWGNPQSKTSEGHDIRNLEGLMAQSVSFLKRIQFSNEQISFTEAQLMNLQLDKSTDIASSMHFGIESA